MALLSQGRSANLIAQFLKWRNKTDTLLEQDPTREGVSIYWNPLCPFEAFFSANVSRLRQKELNFPWGCH